MAAPEAQRENTVEMTTSSLGDPFTWRLLSKYAPQQQENILDIGADILLGSRRNSLPLTPDARTLPHGVDGSDSDGRCVEGQPDGCDTAGVVSSHRCGIQSRLRRECHLVTPLLG